MPDFKESSGMRLPIILGLGESIAKYTLHKQSGLIGVEYGLQLFRNDDGQVHYAFQRKEILSSWTGPVVVLDQPKLNELVDFASYPEDYPDTGHRLHWLVGFGKAERGIDLGKWGINQQIGVYYRGRNDDHIALGYRVLGLPGSEIIVLPQPVVTQMQVFTDK